MILSLQTCFNVRPSRLCNEVGYCLRLATTALVSIWPLEQRYGTSLHQQSLALRRAYDLQIKAAQNILRNNGSREAEVMTSCWINMAESAVLQFRVDGSLPEATRVLKKSIARIDKGIQDVCSQLPGSASELRKEKFGQLLSGKPWPIVETEIAITNDDDSSRIQGERFTCRNIPGRCISIQAGESKRINKKFNGISSISNARQLQSIPADEWNKSPNMWMTQAELPQQTSEELPFINILKCDSTDCEDHSGSDSKLQIVMCIRHGSLSPFATKSKRARAVVASLRARYLLRGAANLQHLRRQGACCGSDGRLRVISVSLLSPCAFSAERRMVKDQLAAMERCNRTNITYKPVNADYSLGKLKRTKVEVATLNVPVNVNGQIPLLSEIAGGWDLSDGINSNGLEVLFGTEWVNRENLDGYVEGWVGEYLISCKNKARKRIILECAKQLHDMWHNKSHRSELTRLGVNSIRRAVKTLLGPASTKRIADSHRFYVENMKFISRVMAVAYLCDIVPLVNCKSGKDRTGLAVAEFMFLMLRILRDGKVPEPNSMTEADKAILIQILHNSGNFEIQELACGAPGYKGFQYVPGLTDRYCYTKNDQDLLGGFANAILS